MLIYAPNPEAEFAPALGGLTGEHKGLLEGRLRAESPPVRFLMELETDGHPAVPRFTLKLHCEDRERALPGVHEVMERIFPLRPRVEEKDRKIAALVRQFARAREADDQIAADVMEGYVSREVQYLLELLLRHAQLDWSVSFWLDGVCGQEISFAPPFGLDMRGYISAAAPETSQRREPFEAGLRASSASPVLERFDVRFGDRRRLTAEGVIRADVAESYPLDNTAFQVRVGASVAHRPGQLVEWAFEFEKR